MVKLESLLHSTTFNKSHLNNISGHKRLMRLSFSDQVFKTLPLNTNNPADDNVFKRRQNNYCSNNKKPLIVDTIFPDCDTGSTRGDFIDSDYASLSVTPAASDSGCGLSHDYQYCVWDWRTTHIGGFMKKQRLRNLKKRLESIGSVKPLPIYDQDIGKPPSQKTTKRSKYNPHEECFVTDVSHRSRRCVIFRKRRHARAFGPINDSMLQKVQVPVDASYNEPRAEFVLDSDQLIQADAVKNGLSRTEVNPFCDTSTQPADENSLKINRLAESVADFVMTVGDGKFWTQLNCKLWNKNDDAPRKDENNRHLAVPPVVVLRKDDFVYILSLLETTCFNEIHNMLLKVLNVPNQADSDNAFCEICQSEASDQNDPIVFCEGCELAVHQNCFGITILPKKGWYCKVCATFGTRVDVRCQFCPLSWGTLKQTGDNGWGHFACSVWQQSLRFENLTTFEPITHEWNLSSDSFMKICSVCDLCYGSCITCSVPNCKIPFHPTCGLRSGLYMTVEDNHRAKIGVKLFSFCAYHSDKARSVRNSTNNRMEFILDQLNMGTINTAAECYKKSKICKLESNFDQFVNWRKIADEIGLSREIMEQIYNYWVKRRRVNHNRPLVSLYEVNDNFIAAKFRNDSSPKLIKRLQMVNETGEEVEEMINDYAKAHCILDKCRNLATLTLRREKLKLQSIMILKEAFDDITSHLEEDLQLSSRFMEKIALALQEQIHGPGRGGLVSRDLVDDESSTQGEEVSRKRGRLSNVSAIRSSKNNRSASFPRPFNRVQEIFAELFDIDDTLEEEVFKSIPSDCI